MLLAASAYVPGLALSTYLYAAKSGLSSATLSTLIVEIPPRSNFQIATLCSLVIPSLPFGPIKILTSLTCGSALYFKAKSKLFTFGRSDLAVINIDDKYGAKLAESIEIPVVKISRSDKADWRYEEIQRFATSTQIKIRGKDGILIEGVTNLIGGYNLDNLLMAVAIAVISGVDPIEISANLASYTGAPGRIEQVNLGQDFLAFVDYAHTPDAVINVLKSAKELAAGKVIAVLGCGGDRDKSKRPLMGKALTAAELPIFTSDNPRSEDPEVILAEMVSGLTHNGVVIADRKAAIEQAVSMAEKGDVVAILGKGHETGQEIAGIKHPFDDRKVLAQAIASRK